jgi:hypothetical protein
MNRVPVTDMWLGHSSVAARWGVSVLASVQSIPLGRSVVRVVDCAMLRCVAVEERTSLFPLKLAATGEQILGRQSKKLTSIEERLKWRRNWQTQGTSCPSKPGVASCQPLRNSVTIVGNNEEVVASSSLTRNGFTATRAPTFRYFRQHHMGPSRCPPTMIRSRPRH